MKPNKTIKRKKIIEQRLPLVSVLMPVYNAGNYLNEAIESILNQTYQNFELILVNDASTDESFSIIKKYRRLFPKKIKVLNLQKTLNCGGDSCANQGIKTARGKYLARMDADDIAHPKRLEKQVEFLEKNKEIFLVGANAYVVDKNGEILGEKLEPLTHQAIRKSYFTFHPLIHPTCLFRRLTDDKPFFYEIKYSANNDYYTFFRLLCEGAKFANLKDRLLKFRIHGKNDTFINVKEKFLNTLKIRFLMVKKYGYRPTVRDWALTFVQAVVVFVLPEKILTEAYLLAKGVKKLTLDFSPSSLANKTRFALGI